LKDAFVKNNIKTEQSLKQLKKMAAAV